MTLFLGIFSAYNYQVSGLEHQVPGLEFNWSDIIIAVLLVLFFVLSSKYAKVSRFSFRLFLLLVVFAGTQLVSVSVFKPPWELVATLFVVLVFSFVKNVLAHNLGVVFGIAGVGAVLGLSIMPKTAVVFLAVLSFYDIIAIYITGHMVRMAKAMIESGATFGFIIPSRFGDFLYSKKEAQANVGERFMILGSGDVVLPLVLASSVIRFSVAGAVTVGIASLMGLFLTHLIFINQKERRPMAALPPIATMAIIGYLLSMWI